MKSALLFLTLTLSSSAQPCPVTIHKFDPYSVFEHFGHHTATVGFANTSDRAMRSIRFGAASNPNQPATFIGLTAGGKKWVFQPGKKSSRDIENVDSIPPLTRVWVEKVEFVDGSAWTDDGSRSCGRDANE